ncbi:E3 ubiquitin-protein ligase RNF186 [Tachysurus fulvidraco]|uniref:E3 ubiquitin-protein ligase RNF186 n=1 Tax=Tachysurus fulvidraco TaxID=1234273 RepID=UPI001FED7FBB|nr:E3 ubiquitin-protein ligase RNF186 [Tachysurus fulvidraco]
MAEEADVEADAGATGCTDKYEEYECKICYNYFDVDRRAPKILECLHTFCEECLHALHLREERPWRVTCPVCRHRTPVPDYRIRNLPNNTKVTEDFPLRVDVDVDPVPQDALPPHPPPLHPALAVLRRDEASSASGPSRHVHATPSTTASTATMTLSQDSVVSRRDSCHEGCCRRLALTAGCACVAFSFVAMLALLFAGLVFVHGNSGDRPPSPAGPVCLSVASVLAMVSVVVTWLLCWLKYRPEHEATGRASTTSNNSSRRNA